MANRPQLDRTSEVLTQYGWLMLAFTLKGAATKTKPAKAGFGLIRTVLSSKQLRLRLLELPLGLSCFEVSKEATVGRGNETSAIFEVLNPAIYSLAATVQSTTSQRTIAEGGKRFK